MSVQKAPHGMARPRRSRWLMTRGLQLRISVPGQGGTKLFRHNFGELGASQFPPIETALIDGEPTFLQHSAGLTSSLP